MRTARTTRPRFRIGDWVSFLYGMHHVWAQVIEDRGQLGVKGRRLYRIRWDQTYSEPIESEIPEDYLEAATLDKADILRYLKQGGLVALLQTHLIRGKSKPRVWLTFTYQGEITHTLDAARGSMGGIEVPFFALLEEKVFAPKTEEVLTFLKGFGLSRAEAEEVVATVGTAP